MPPPRVLLLVALAGIAVEFVILWVRLARTAHHGHDAPAWPTGFDLSVGVVTDFLDTLGVGSFATTATAYGLARRIDDRLIPGTLNVGHALPTVAQALIYVTIVRVDPTTLLVMIGAAVAGGWLGSGIVSRWPRRAVRLAVGGALVLATILMVGTIARVLPVGGTASSLSGPWLAVGATGNFVLGALMSAGVGLYAPCMILVSLLGMSPEVAFPVMMGSCAFLMPIGSVEFIRRGAYDVRAALGLTLGGVPAVLVAAFVVKSLPLDALRWLVVAVATYTAATLLRAGLREQGGGAT